MRPEVISEAPKHLSVAFTMDVYSHIISGMQEDAMAPLDEALPPDANGKGAAGRVVPVLQASVAQR